MSYAGLSCYGSHPQYANMSTYVARLIDVTENNTVLKSYSLAANGNVGGSGSYGETWLIEFKAGHTYKLEAVNTFRHPDIVSYEGYMSFAQSLVVCDLK